MTGGCICWQSFGHTDFWLYSFKCIAYPIAAFANWFRKGGFLKKKKTPMPAEMIAARNYWNDKFVHLISLNRQCENLNALAI